MNSNISQFFINAFIILQFAFSGGFAIANNSPVEVDRKIENKFRSRLFGNRNVLGNNFEFTYSFKVKDTDTVNRFQPLLIDYTLFQYFYVESSNPNWNPIRPFELHNAKFYFDSSALIAKEREQVYTDFYIKYNAAITFLHFWITRFVIKYTMLLVPEDKAERDKKVHDAFLWKCDELTFYAYWLVDLEVDRHLDEIDLKLRTAVPKDKKFHEVVTAYETIIKTLKGLVEIEPFRSPIRHRLYEFNQKINPFNPRVAPVEIEPQDEKWMRIVQHVQNVEAQKKPFVGPENFFKNSYDDYDRTFSTDHVNDLSKYMKYLHDNSWSAIKMVIGRELFIVESFFYSSLTGESYKLAESFKKPEFSFAKKLWRELECIYYFWSPITAKKSKIDDYCKNSPKSYYSKPSQEEHKLYLIRVLRVIDGLRFHKSSLISLNVTFKLKTCSECFFRCWCFGSFRMIDK